MGRFKHDDVVLAQRVSDGQVVNVNLTNLYLHSNGAFSNVYRGKAEDDSGAAKREVAIKKTWKQHSVNEVVDIDAIQEIKILKVLNRLNHKNIVQLLYDFANDYKERTCYALIFEFLPETLYSYMKTRQRRLSLIDIKLFTWQLFRGQAHLSKASIIHRDIKPQNLLVKPETGLLKISDFGSSTIAKKDQRQPSYHVTRYYRPPELLLEAKMYGTEVDVWSCGCVFGEMLAGRTLLAGRNSSHQLDLVIEHFGMPTREQAANMRCPVRTYNKITEAGYRLAGTYPKLYKLIPDHQPAAATQLLTRVLVYSPQERLCGLSFLMDSFFDELFHSKTRRNQQRIEAVTLQDLQDVRHGDGDWTANSFSEKPNEESTHTRRTSTTSPRNTHTKTSSTTLHTIQSISSQQ